MRKTLHVLVTLIVWASIVFLVIWVWDSALIEKPSLFYPTLFGLIVFSAAFSSAETAFTILQEDWQKVAESRELGVGQVTKLQTWLAKYNPPSKFVKLRHRLVAKNLEGPNFATLLPFLLVMNNLINLGGMYLVGRGLSVGAVSERLSLVISAVIVVIFGEVVAKFFAFRLPAATASWTVLIISLLKPLLGWYTDHLIRPIEGLLKFLFKS